jgi:hypothetical protein
MTLTNKDEYYNAMNAQNSLQNSLSGLGQYSQSIGSYRSNPLDGCDITSIPTDEIQKMLLFLTNEYDRRVRHTPMVGPTKAELENNPSLKEAWEAFEIIRKLQGKSK